ncbi:MAG: SemiSWEET transporter [Endomicrobia bacterium]|nr:SemiSWEET transporter [Endomicrobiia bacterium]
MSIEIVGLAAGVFATIAFVPQVYKTWKSKSAKDVSMHMFLIFITGVTLWIIYGAVKKIPAVMISNIIIFILAALQIFLKIKYDRNKTAMKNEK